jgi:hypothetical protein
MKKTYYIYHIPSVKIGCSSEPVKRVKDQGDGNKNPNDTTKNSAIQFNETIKGFYSSDAAQMERISHATNYFIERMNKIKAIDPPSRASAMIPVSVNFSTDGISGMAMGQSFTIQDELLPYSYTTRKMPYGLPSYDKKVGFIIIGLDHEISNNRWSTSVRSNMYFLKDSDLYNGVELKYSTADSATIKVEEPAKSSVTNDETNDYTPSGTGCDRKSIGKCGKDNSVECDDMECLKSDFPNRRNKWTDKKIKSSNYNFNYSSLSGKYLTYTKNKKGEAVSDGSGGPFGQYFGGAMKEVRGIMIHHTADHAKTDGTVSTAVYNNPNRQVSYNYVIGYTGNIYQITPKNVVAYHSGTGYYKTLNGKECGVTRKCSTCSGDIVVGGGGGNSYYLAISMEGAPGYDKTYGNGSASQFDSTARLTISLMEEHGLTPSASRPLSDIIITHGIYTYNWRRTDVIPNSYNEILWRIRTIKPQWANF